MTSIQINCPSCAVTLKLNAGQANQLKITCPKCKTPFTATINRMPADDLSNLDFADPSFNSHLGPAPLSPSYPGHRSGSNRRAILITVLGTFAVLGVLACFFVATVVAPKLVEMANAPREVIVDSPHRRASNSITNALTSAAASLDSEERLREDIKQQAHRIEEYGLPLKSQTPTPEIAAKFDAEQEVLWGLIFRAARLTPTVLTAEEARALNAEHEALIERLKQNRGEAYQEITQQQDFNKEFWQVVVAPGKDPTTTDIAIGRLSTLMGASSILASLNKQLPDPQVGEAIKTEWTQHDRHQLAIGLLRARFDRDFSRELVAIDPLNINLTHINRLFALIDQYASEARKLSAQRPPESDSKLFGKQIRGTIYHRHAAAAFYARSILSQIYRHEMGEAGREFSKHDNPFLAFDEKSPTEAQAKLAFAFEEANQMTGLIDSLVFSPKFERELTAIERYEKHRTKQLQDAEKVNAKEGFKRQLAAQSADAVKRSEAERVASEAKARQEAEQRVAEQEQQRKKDQQSTEQIFGSDQPLPSTTPTATPKNNLSQNAGSSTSNIVASNPSPFPTPGPDPFDNRPRTGPPGFDFNTDLSKYPDAVQIHVENIRLSLNVVMENAQKKFITSSKASNQKMDIIIYRYDDPLETLADVFPTLEFTNIDRDTRRITAKQK